MMKSKFYFNMVEIALAIAIIAIGVSAIMVLFPIGINASRAAMDETNFPDAAEFVARFVKGKVLAHWKSNADENPSNPLFTAPTCFSQTSKPNDPASNATPQDVTGYCSEIKEGEKVLGWNGLKDFGGGCYKYSRVGDKGEEIFSADVKIWNATAGLSNTNEANGDCPLYMPNYLGEQKFAKDLKYNEGSLDGSGTVSFKGFAYSAMVKIKWNGNVRTFRVDVYNPYFILVATP